METTVLPDDFGLVGLAATVLAGDFFTADFFAAGADFFEDTFTAFFAGVFAAFFATAFTAFAFLAAGFAGDFLFAAAFLFFAVAISTLIE
ncbi:MAG: hypothetical protein U0Y08_01805 [Bacteroidia bacterium]